MDSKVSVRKNATQSDVARLAGVSRPMVSYVITNDTSVSISPDTRQRILDAIEQLGYKPDRLAQGLRTRRTFTIACVIPDITNPFYPAFQRGIQDVARQQSYAVVTYNTDGIAAEERHALQFLLQNRVDGVIGSFWYLTEDDLRQLLDHNIHVVKMDVAPYPNPDLAIDCVYVDNAVAARKAVEYLISCDHTRVGMIAGQETALPREARVLGYRQALAAHYIPLDEILVRTGDFTEAGGYRAMGELLQLSPRPTAVFVSNDLMAMGALIAAREADVNVPHEIAIVGFDDIPAAKLVHPPLTTVNQFADRLGRRAAEMLFERLSGSLPASLRNEEMQSELVIRASA